jgi:DNA polymerase-3 subunit beta
MDYNNTRAKFPVKHLRSLALFQANNDIRYYLNGILIERAEPEREGVYLVATDGHTMLVIYEPEGKLVHSEPRLIMRLPKDMVSAASRNRRDFGRTSVIAKGTRVSIGLDFEFEQGDGEVYVQPGNPWIDGRYPDWRAVLPHFDLLKPTISDAIQAKYVARFSKVGDSTDKYGSPIKLWQREPGRAILVQLAHEPNMLGIIMPMRGDSEHALIGKLRNIVKQPPLPEPEQKDPSAQSGTAC